MRARASVLAGLLLSLFPAVALVAATHVWSGLGATPEWSNGFNWSTDPNTPATPPFNDPNGVFLQFPAGPGVAQHFMFQDISGLIVNSMTFSGSPYNLNGFPTLVDGSIASVNDPNDPSNPFVFHAIDLPLLVPTTLTSDVGAGASELRVHGSIDGPGGVTIVGPGTTALAGFNTYMGPTLVSSGTLVAMSPAALGSGSGVTTVAQNATLELLGFNPVEPETIVAAGGARLRALGPNTVFSIITLPGLPTFFEILPGSQLNVASLGGDGQIFVDFGGTLRITGPSPSTGFLTIGNASLIVNGALINTSLLQLIHPNSVLAGTGAVGSVQVLSGTVSPGESAGILTVAGNLTCTGAAAFRVELDGLAAGTGYDQLNLTGSVDLGPSTTLVATRSFLPPIGSAFTIISATSVSGQFVGLPDLQQFTIAGQTYEIDYTPTSVVLTAIDAVPVTLQHFTLE